MIDYQPTTLIAGCLALLLFYFLMKFWYERDDLQETVDDLSISLQACKDQGFQVPEGLIKNPHYGDRLMYRAYSPNLNDSGEHDLILDYVVEHVSRERGDMLFKDKAQKYARLEETYLPYDHWNLLVYRFNDLVHCSKITIHT